MLDSCFSVNIPAEWGFKREPARDPALRYDYFGGMKFDDNFDWDTLFYDAVRLEPWTVLLIGPPLYEMKDHIRESAYFRDQNSTPLSVAFYELDRVCLTAISSSRRYPIDELELVTPTECTRIPISPRSRLFDDKRVLITLQRDNPIEWIQQWMEYHAASHGINGFLIYDNRSLYSRKLIDQLCSKPGRTVVVVNWPFPYGPQGGDFMPWDSDYCQYGMLEHARHRYVHDAELVINGDIDEPILSDRDIGDISTRKGGVSYGGFWVSAFSLRTRVSACDVAYSRRNCADYAGVDVTRKHSNLSLICWQEPRVHFRNESAIIVVIPQMVFTPWVSC